MRKWGLAAGLLLVITACGGDEPAGPTDRELLVAIMEGSPTDAEVEAKFATADLLCGLSPEVLNSIWDDLEPAQFAFQEFVFQHRCPRDDTFLLDLRTAKKNATAATTTTSTTTTSTTAPVRRTTTTRRTTTSTSG